ncbi:unnamed protein product [Rotaria sordida]|uniref:FAD-binding domain-containing protein n=1 Tax=Rotaria sordida TaxID=392033 RepID=A0A814NJ68_9BILA|nr:unnamed protein product [Rotaria sordida]CAF3716974.1 unnamed protein product [Rotaria sordida]
MTDILIAGAGISGLVTALCLHRAGFSVRIHERAQKLEEAGFGLNLQPYCVKLLYELGLESEMNEVGIRNNKAVLYSRHGQFIHQDPRGLDAGYKWPMYSMHRGRFQQLLLRHVREEIGAEVVRLGQKLVSFRSQPHYVEVDFVNSITGEFNTERAKVLLGADGINSTVRKILYPDEGPPLWQGITMWRGVTRMDKLYLDGRTMIFVGNPDDRNLIVYPVSEELVNWAFTVRIEEPGIRPAPMTTDWHHLGHIEDVLPLLSDMKLDFLDIPNLISSSIIVNQFHLTDRDPLPRWTYDRVTLIGDAAHPMYPHGGNGCSQAILDARDLVLAFRAHGITPAGLEIYDQLRRPVLKDSILAAREFGPDKILKIIDERAPFGFQNLSEVISSEELDKIFSVYRKQVNWNVEKLNQELPLF